MAAEMSKQNWEVFPRPQYMADQFDRRTFNPRVNPDHKRTLEMLRVQGRSRAWHCVRNIRYSQWPYEQTHQSDHFWCCASAALKGLWDGCFVDLKARGVSETYVDVGAGDSPDVLIARGLGYSAYSVDLFPPQQYSPVAEVLSKSEFEFFIQADAVERLPFDDYSADYISCQAMIALVPPDERARFYREVCRVLKIGGMFSLSGVNLRCGYGWKQSEEKARALELEFWGVSSALNGFTATRTH